MDLERSPLARPFPDMPAIAGVTPRIARAGYKDWGRCDLTYIELADELWRVCAGTLVVSGILAERWGEVRSALGGSPGEVHDVSGWVTAALRP